MVPERLPGKKNRKIWQKLEVLKKKIAEIREIKKNEN